MSLISNLFSSQNKEFHDFTKLETDIHSHLIPAIDDGSKSVDESIELLKQIEKTGLKRIVLTPHVNEYYPNEHAQIVEAFKKFETIAKEYQINIEFHCAAEYLLNAFMEELIDKNEILSFGKNKFVMVELSFFSPQPNYKNIIAKIHDKGYSVILAHPERYSYWFDNLDSLFELKNAGVYMQLNLLSLTGFHGHLVKKQAQKLLKNNIVDFAGTDVHNQTYVDEFHSLFKNSTYYDAVKKSVFKNHLIF